MPSRDKSLNVPAHSPREWLLYHQASAGIWTLSQLTGPRGGQLVAAAPRAGPSGGGRGKRRRKQLASPPPSLAAQEMEGFISITVRIWHRAPALRFTAMDGGERRKELQARQSDAATIF